ncbi:MAG TPA: transketolase, partial [Caulobacter sp.]|nr:transketolase [Caulobacter sp.]
FEAQDEAYRAAVIGAAGIRIAVEAGVREGWDRYIGADGGFVGMTGYGASAPAAQLFETFGITPKHVVELARAKLAGTDRA